MKLVLAQRGGSLLVRYPSGQRLRLEAGRPADIEDEAFARGLIAEYPNVVPFIPEAEAIDEAEAEAEAQADVESDPTKHPFVPDRGGVECIVCEKTIDAHVAAGRAEGTDTGDTATEAVNQPSGPATDAMPGPERAKAKTAAKAKTKSTTKAKAEPAKGAVTVADLTSGGKRGGNAPK